MSLTEEERKAIVTYRLEKATRTFEQAVGNINLGYWEVIANRLYYAAYYAVSALLIANRLSAHTHNGVIQVFGLNFIKNQIIPSEYGKLYSQLFSLRQTGDYDDTYDLSEEDVIPLIEPAKHLIEIVSERARLDLQSIDKKED